jgi:hypothetical protein
MYWDRCEDSVIPRTVHRITAGPRIVTSCTAAWYAAYRNILSIIQMGTGVSIMKGCMIKVIFPVDEHENWSVHRSLICPSKYSFWVLWLKICLAYCVLMWCTVPRLIISLLRMSLNNAGEEKQIHFMVQSPYFSETWHQWAQFLASCSLMV